MTSSTLGALLARIDGGVTAPLGFTSASLHCGIKAKPGALDLTVIAAAQPVKVFFLVCVIVAGIYGAWSVSRRILWVQAAPAAAALALLLGSA